MLTAIVAMQNRSSAQSINGDALVKSVSPADFSVCDVVALNGQSALVHLINPTDSPRGILILFCGGIALLACLMGVIAHECMTRVSRSD